ncbi:hypothetical protein R9C00_27185 [Flammeovirgaceae bacterium SG7u.111]|nr:hypothetical protein [Flammeovirgaceae bacterium SG7u.132]WPO35386.1 hypothetical protein R9C00_27185 [Flammeovirgaceae bacterium SG7u.111]
MVTLKESFVAGFYAAASGGYFNSMDLLGHYTNFPNPQLLSRVSDEMKTLQNDTPKVMGEVMNVQSIAEKNHIILLPAPRFPEAYFSWSKIANEGFNEKIGEDSPEGTAFNIAYRAGEVMTAMKVLTVVLSLSSSVVGVPAFEEQWKYLAKDMIRAAKKMGPPAKMAMMIPKGPDLLHDTLYVEVSEAAHEIGNAEIDFSNEAYLHLLSSKVNNYITSFNQKVNWLIKELGSEE